MRKRRYLATSDDEEDDAPPQRSQKQADGRRSPRRNRKRLKIHEDDYEEDEREEAIKPDKKKPADDDKVEEKGDSSPVNDAEGEAQAEDAKPIGDVVRISGKGKSRKNHYKSFEFDGITYDLEDPVLLVPDSEEPMKKPYIAIIKDITETKVGSVMVYGQWFYRPEEAERKGGGNWQSNDARELFYSSHRDEVPAESIMHKCVVHFIPENKQIPSRKKYPGFIVQKVYDTILKRLFMLTDRDYEDDMQYEIDLLVQITMSRLGDLPDIKNDDVVIGREDHPKSKRLLRRRNMSPLEVTRAEDAASDRSGPLSKSETPGNCNTSASDYCNMLVKFDAVTSDQHDKLLETVQYVCNNVDDSQSGGNKKESDGTNVLPPSEPQEKVPNNTFLPREKMRNRRYLATSDDEEDDAPPQRLQKQADGRRSPRRNRKRLKIHEDDYEEDEKEEAIKPEKVKPADDDKVEEKGDSPPVNDVEGEAQAEDAKPIGDVVRISGKGKSRKNHYKSFEYDGITYDLEDPVLLVPDSEGPNKKPYVAIIKDITETKDGSVMVNGQWFYRPEEAERKGGGNWQSNDPRELFYSFHRDEIPAESIMHKCVVHFIPENKQIPSRRQHPGFIVQKVYDTILKRLFKLTDKDYEDDMQHEIDVLVQKTMSRLGDLPDIKNEDVIIGREDHPKSKRLLRRRNMSPLEVTRDEDAASDRSGPLSKSETPGSCNTSASDYYNILVKFDAVTGDQQRDKWLDKLLETVQYVCNNVDGSQSGGNRKESDGTNVLPPSEPQEKVPNNGTGLPPVWPKDAVRAVVALEQASHESLSADFTKYNQKMRQLVFNLKKNAQLARRLLTGELEPSKILNMTPIELKEGLTAEEKARKEPEENAHVQMTDARCKRCTEKKVHVVDIISGRHADRYQLECSACGNMWYASRDEASTLTINGPSSSKTVGTAPSATAKFVDVEKKLVSPREPATANDSLKKPTGPSVPEKQKSGKKLGPEDQDNPPPAAT